ncbi:MAG: hypothetical protein F2786_06525 [Actinobacteria bacterium]|uniref:Unannotated protein n=1 Tax=freshwater metagenome TaxID=449393 RepID=A0A6J7E065_9ZZZZ|nr:hypothetical protein [Actinomycetota bacterium]
MNQKSSWEEELIKYCRDFNIPIDYLSDILRDSKVNPMIRGKGFEFSTLVAFQNILRTDIWEVSKPNMNAQAMQHDVDILVKHIPSGKTISVECKLSKKDSFRISKTGEITAAVKCMRSRTLGQEIIEDRAPIMGVTVEQLNAHKDNYLTTDFDVVASSFGNAFYTTDKESGEYIWTPASSHQEVIEKILQNPNVDLKKAAFDYILVAKASDLSPSAGFYPCARKTCKHRDSCAFIPNYPVVKFDNRSGAPIKPWNSLRALEDVLLEVLSKK